MAARTLTYTINMQAQPRAFVTGVNTVAFDFNSGATKWGTLSDVVLLGKIPNGALITNAGVRFGVAPQAAAHCQLVLLVQDALGTYSAYATVIPSMTASAAIALFANPAPLKVSLSDDRAIQFVTLALNCTTGASESVSFSFQGNVQYVATGQSV